MFPGTNSNNWAKCNVWLTRFSLYRRIICVDDKMSSTLKSESKKFDSSALYVINLLLFLLTRYLCYYNIN